MKGIEFRYFKEHDIEEFAPAFLRKEEENMVYPSLCLHNVSDYGEWFQSQMKTWHDYFSIVDSKDNVIGYSYTYSFNRMSGLCKICLQLLPQYRTMGIGAICALKMGDYLFSSYPLRKIYAEVFSYNHDSVSMCERIGMRREGVLEEVRFYNGDFFNQIIYSINRESFYTVFNKFF